MSNDFLRRKQSIFDCWAPSYDWLFPSIVYQAIHQRLLEFVHLPVQASVLDLGCGTGRLLNRSADQFPNLTGKGLDLSPEMLRQAELKNCHPSRLNFVQGSAEALPFQENEFDTVFSTLSFLHYPNPEMVFAEVSRVLRPAGHFYLVDPVLRWQAGTQTLPMPAGAIKFYGFTAREQLGRQAGLICQGHHYLLGPVVLTIYAKANEE
ncbi:class I SAM-dependent methyltransferase [Leptothermofonsia sp. ETS-13]|uniref:class I SAM-dependent methyltransferase n=1 Tax=Leptothermofonsia sp. ETS-13 TaxID=3035696 RepID=UPI003BA0EB39